MARVVVRRNTFEFGEFPPVCCKTGESATVYNRWEFRGRRFAGVLPVSTKAMRRLSGARRAVWVWGAAAVFLASIGLVTASKLVVAGLALAGLAAFFLLLVWWWSPDAKLENGTVQLSRVHPRFIEAIKS